MSSIYNTQVDNAKDIGLVMPMYKLVEYSDDHSETFGSLWQYYIDEPGLTDDDAVDNFSGNSTSFKFKQKIAGTPSADGIKRT